MGSAAAWLAFWAELAPEAIALARDLYERFNGDPARAKAEIRRIRDHGATWEATRRHNDAIMADLHAQRDKPKE